MMSHPDRYDTSKNPENIYYQNTQILINKLSVKDALLLKEVEKQLLERTLTFYLNKAGIIGKFDSKLLCEIHRYFLSRLYKWAGKYRTVSLAKGKTRFASPKFIPNLMKDFDNKIAKDNFIIGLAKGPFLEKLAYYKCELIAIHPFREGNGRTIRLFCDLLAVKNGFKPFKYSVGKNDFAKKYIEASQIGVIKADHLPMLRILARSFRK